MMRRLQRDRSRCQRMARTIRSRVYTAEKQDVSHSEEDEVIRWVIFIIKFGTTI